jgi:hypothetical protein
MTRSTLSRISLLSKGSGVFDFKDFGLMTTNQGLVPRCEHPQETTSGPERPKQQDPANKNAWMAPLITFKRSRRSRVFLNRLIRLDKKLADSRAEIGARGEFSLGELRSPVNGQRNVEVVGG